MAHRTNNDEHPDWCHVARCHALSLGEHRSEPVVVGVGPAGHLVATRTRTRGGRDRLELRVLAPLAAGTEGDQAADALRVMNEVVYALNRAARVSARRTEHRNGPRRERTAPGTCGRERTPTT